MSESLISPILQKLRVRKSQVRRPEVLRAAYPMVPGAPPVRPQRSRCAVNLSPGATWPVGNAKREGNAEASSGPAEGERGGSDSATILEQVQRLPPPPPSPSAEADWSCPGALAQDSHRCVWGGGGRERHLHTPTPEVAATQAGEWRKAARGEGTVLTGGGRAGAGPWPGSSMAATAPQDAWGTCRSSAARG